MQAFLLGVHGHVFPCIVRIHLPLAELHTAFVIHRDLSLLSINHVTTRCILFTPSRPTSVSSQAYYEGRSMFWHSRRWESATALTFAQVRFIWLRCITRTMIFAPWFLRESRDILSGSCTPHTSSFPSCGQIGRIIYFVRMTSVSPP